MLLIGVKIGEISFLPNVYFGGYFQVIGKQAFLLGLKQRTSCEEGFENVRWWRSEKVVENLRKGVHDIKTLSLICWLHF